MAGLFHAACLSLRHPTGNPKVPASDFSPRYLPGKPGTIHLRAHTRRFRDRRTHNSQPNQPHTTITAVSGSPPVIAFEPMYLASALEIGPTLRLIDGMSPLLASGPGGVFCVLMPRRCPVEAMEQQGVPTAVAVAA